MCRIGGSLWSQVARSGGGNLEIPPLQTLKSNLLLLTRRGTLSGGQFDWGGRLLKSNGGARWSPQPDWKPGVECIGIRGLDCETYKSSRCESRPKWSGGPAWKGHRSTDKRYSGDNRLIPPKSPYRRRSLAPRCRLITSWGWSRSQGFGCSPIKVVRELGSERRETVWSLSSVGVRNLSRPVLSTRGPGWTNLWCSSCSARSSAG